MRTNFIVILGFFAAVLLSKTQLALAAPDASGTYRLQVCKGPCIPGSSANVVVKGILVLSAQAFTIESLNQASGKRFEYAYSIGPEPNGCFVLETVKTNQTYAGLIELGVTHWRVHSEEVLFELYTSPDAGYFVRAAMTADGFHGQGDSSSAITAEPKLGPDVVVGRRITPTDLDACIRAVQKLAIK